jgi:glyoxylase I family protein
MAMAFSHVALNCKDMRATEKFYTTHFGFRRARVIPLGEAQIVFLKAGSVYLELFASEGAAPGAAPAPDGPHHPGSFRHIAFQVDNVDQTLAAMGTEAQVSLGPLNFDDFIPGWRTAWVKDPDGNIVEISQGYTDQKDVPPAA